MATLERRVQVLLDEDRYQQAVATARERGVSVGQVVRDALDASLGSDARRRSRALALILEAEHVPMPDVEELKREIAEGRVRP